MFISSDHAHKVVRRHTDANSLTTPKQTSKHTSEIVTILSFSRSIFRASLRSDRLMNCSVFRMGNLAMHDLSTGLGKDDII